jgi:hypothetical protein
VAAAISEGAIFDSVTAAGAGVTAFSAIDPGASRAMGWGRPKRRRLMPAASFV